MVCPQRLQYVQISLSIKDTNQALEVSRNKNLAARQPASLSKHLNVEVIFISELVISEIRIHYTKIV